MRKEKSDHLTERCVIQNRLLTRKHWLAIIDLKMSTNGKNEEDPPIKEVL